LQLGVGTTTEVVIAECSEEHSLCTPASELPGRYPTAAGSERRDLRAVRDFARNGYACDTDELDPLDVPDDGDSHASA
jgi:hypothetical protein